MGNLITLKFGTHKGTKFGRNTVNSHKVILDYLQNVALICCHTHGVKCAWQKAEN